MKAERKIERESARELNVVSLTPLSFAINQQNAFALFCCMCTNIESVCVHSQSLSLNRYLLIHLIDILLDKSTFCSNLIYTFHKSVYVEHIWIFICMKCMLDLPMHIHCYEMYLKTIYETRRKNIFSKKRYVNKYDTQMWQNETKKKNELKFY